MTNNRLQATVSTADRDAILSALATIRAKLPFLLALSLEESRSLARLGDKSRAFVEKAVDLAVRHPEILPGTFELDELKADLELFATLYPIMMQIAELHNLVGDTVAVAGNEAYTAARMVYSYAKISGLSAELDPLIDDLSKRYRRKSAAQPPVSGQ